MSSGIVADGMERVLKKLEEEERSAVESKRAAIKAETDLHKRSLLKAELKQIRQEFAKRRKAASGAYY